MKFDPPNIKVTLKKLFGLGLKSKEVRLLAVLPTLRKFSMVGPSRYRCVVAPDNDVNQPNLLAWPPNVAAISPVCRLPIPPPSDPEIGIFRPDLVVRLTTAPSVWPNSAGIPPVMTSTCDEVLGSIDVENIADMLSVIGTPLTTV